MLTDWRDRLEEARDERELTDLERDMLKAIRKLQKQPPAKRKRLVSDDDDDLTALLYQNDVTASSLGLSPIFDLEVVFNGLVYPTPMNAFQAQKADSSGRTKYTVCSVAEASKHGRAEAIDISKWDAEKYDLMQDILRETLLQHPETAKCLVEASVEYLVEDTLRDPYWPHHLPQIWRTLRDELRADQAAKDED